jgi:NADH:ubiquinone oxidoreductase subunit K
MSKASVVNFGTFCLLGAISWTGIAIVFTVMSALGDGAGSISRGDAVMLFAPSLYLLLLFIASFLFITWRPAISILVIADAALLIFVVGCTRLGKMADGATGEIVAIAVACAFVAVGVAGHRLLWDDKKRRTKTSPF